MAVFGPSGFDEPQNLAELLHRHERLASWLAADGRALRHDRAGLTEVDSLLDGWRDDREIGPMVGNEVGPYLGCVVVDAVPEAHWSVRPNGQPVVSVAGQELNVIEIVARRLDTGHPRLPDVLDGATERR